MNIVAPPVYATSKDYEALSALAEKLRTDAGPGPSLLRQEVSRLQVSDAAPKAFVALGDRVKYQNPRNDRVKVARLVLPKDQTLHESTVPVTSPMGAALLGLKPGDEFHWQEPGGAKRRVKVLDVVD